MYIDNTNPDTFVNVFTIDNVLAFLTLVITYTGINGILIRERNKYINLIQENFPQVKEFSKRVYNYKLFVRLTPLLILPLVIIVYLFFFIFIHIFASILLYDILELSFDTEKKVFLILVTSFILGFIIILLYSYGDKLIKAKKWFPQMVMVPNLEIKYSLVSIYLYFLILIEMIIVNDYVILIHLDSYVYMLDDSINIHISNKTIIFSAGIILTIPPLINLIKKILWFNITVPKMLSEAFKLDLPPIKLKTEAGEVIGLVKDLYNPNFVTLSEGDIHRFIPWDEIKVIEICFNNQDTTREAIEAPVANETKKHFWEFWK